MMSPETRISEHLVWGEVRCGCHRLGQADRCRGGRLSHETAELFERIRAACSHHLGHDCSIRVTSGVRCPIHNRRAGGARDSAHLEGKALDLLCPRGISLEEFWMICEKETGAGGFGRYLWGAHVDTRVHPPCRRWSDL